MADKVIVGLSGGVDSSVAALLLLQQDCDVEALFMKNWDEQLSDGACIWETDVADAMQVCDRLGIRLNTVDLTVEYWQSVFTEFLKEYGAGRTPNPDILCNQEVKFKAFLDHALKLGADRIATGHYARIHAANHGLELRKGADPLKEQSYFLCRLDQRQLGLSRFPIGHLQKPEVRKLAARAGLVTHDKKDSTGICFVGERPFRDFLSRYIPVQNGPIRTLAGQTIGEHLGVHFYTLGQRQGLGIGGVKGAQEKPWYVVGKDVAANTLLVAQGQNHPMLYCRRLSAVNLHWISGQPPAAPYACFAKCRYRQADQPCVIDTLSDNRATVKFRHPQRAVTPGQYIVFYQGEICLGGGVIDATG
jgi:tRNA-specific 2-thiouridylase